LILRIITFCRAEKLRFSALLSYNILRLRRKWRPIGGIAAEVLSDLSEKHSFSARRKDGKQAPIASPAEAGTGILG